MEHNQLINSLIADLIPFTAFLRENKSNLQVDDDEFKNYVSSCRNLYHYCKNVKKSACSDIYHSELLIIFKLITDIKSSISGNNTSPTGIFSLLGNLECALDADFYKDHLIIQGGMFPAITDVEKDELKLYIEKGKYLKTLDLTVKLKEELASLRRGRSSYYCALIGPSFMGKTQTAFTLSHLMNVFYLNFSGILGDSRFTEQRIYRAMKPLSHFFLTTIKSDINHLKYLETPNGGIGFFLNRSSESDKFETLGLIFTLLKWRSIHPELDNDPEAWFMSFWKMENIVIQPLSIATFRSKIAENGFSMDDCLIFSDELPSDSKLKLFVRFLRNLCRAIFMPSMLSGTNAAVTNLIDEEGIPNSAPAIEEGPKPWVKVVTKTPPVPLQCLGCSIEVKLGDKTVKLSHYIENNELQYDRLLTEIGVKQCHIPFVKSILNFLIDQSKTALPGLISVCISAAFKELGRYGDDSFVLDELWSSIMDTTTTMLCKRKKNVLSKHGIISSAHLVTLPSAWKNLHGHFNETVKTVDEHYYYFESQLHSIFDLCLSTTVDEGTIMIYLNGSPFKDLSYFPELKDDFVLTMACLNSVLKNVDYRMKSKGTLAYHLQLYLEDSYKFKVASLAIVPDSFSLELLVHWCNCFGSHLGRYGTLKVVEYMFQNIQFITRTPDGIGIDFKPLVVPSSLSQFLERIEIPYLFPGATQDRPIVQQVAGFMKMGNSYRPENSIGWDVEFEVTFDGSPSFRKCYIECKLWASAVGIPMIYTYYVKACRAQNPLSILVAKKFQESLENPDVFERKIPLSPNEKSEEEKEEDDDADEIAPDNISAPKIPAKRAKNDKKVKAKASKAKAQEEEDKPAPVKKDYITLLENLWNDPNNHINIYTIKFDESDLSFKCTALKEFPNPIGVFLVVNSNFSPPTRSGNN